MDVLHRDKPTLLVEVLNDDVARRIQCLVDGLGYEYYNIDERGPCRRTARIEKSTDYNYLLIQPEAALELFGSRADSYQLYSNGR